MNNIVINPIDLGEPKFIFISEIGDMIPAISPLTKAIKNIVIAKRNIRSVKSVFGYLFVLNRSLKFQSLVSESEAFDLPFLSILHIIKFELRQQNT